jgi:signal transduction histidine kinase
MAGIISALIGAMMLIVPHQFTNISYALIVPHLTWWGVAFLLSGLALLAAGELQPRRPVLIVIHLLVGLTWLFLSLGFLLNGGWIGATVWSMYGLGIAVAPLLGERRTSVVAPGTPDLFAVLGGLSSTIIGLIIIVMNLTTQFSAPYYYQILTPLTYNGLAMIIAGPLLLFSSLSHLASLRILRWTAHLLVGGLFLVFGVSLSLQVQAWTGTVLYAGIGLSLALAPLIQERLHNIAPNSLPVRMSVFASIALTISLVLAVTLATRYFFGGLVNSLGEENTRSLRDLTLGVLFVSLAVAVAATAYTARWVGRPLRDLTVAASKLAAGDRTAVLPRSGVQEVQDLVTSFAEMRQRLAAREAERDRQERRTALMLHAIQSASGSLELDQVLQRVAEALVEAMGVPYCAIYLLDPEGRFLVPRALAAEIGATQRATFWLYHPDTAVSPILRESLEGQQPVIFDDLLNDPQATTLRDAIMALGPAVELKSLLGVPIKFGNRVLGIAALATINDPHSFQPDEIDLARAVIGAVALAIENARLYEETRRLYEHQQHLAIVEERQRIARELHDSVTQGLYAVTLYGEAASLHLQAGDLGTLGEHLHEIQAISQEGLREMRLLIFELRPPVLEKQGLVAALQARLDSVEARGGIETTLQVEGEPRLTAAVEEGLYRIAQEALNNTLKHAHPSRVQVRLEFFDDLVSLEVQDDGVGFDPGGLTGKGGLGVKGMAERAQQIGGTVAVTSAPGQGTRVRVEVALAETAPGGEGPHPLPAEELAHSGDSSTGTDSQQAGGAGHEPS